MFEGFTERNVGSTYQRKGRAPETACESVLMTKKEAIEPFFADGVTHLNVSYSLASKIVVTFCVPK